MQRLRTTILWRGCRSYPGVITQVDTKPQSAAIDAIAWLEPPLLFPRTVAGRSYDVRIGDRSTVLTLPSEGLTQFGGAPPPKAPGPTPTFPPPPLAETFVPGRVHAVVTVAQTPGKHVLAVGAIRLRWHGDDLTRATGALHGTRERSFAEDFGDWLSIVRDWLAAWSGQARDSIHRAPRPIARLASFDDPDAAPVMVGGPVTTIVTGQRAASTYEIKGAFAAASHRHELPLEYQLFNEAIVYAYRNQNRHAVISACSAAEVALSEGARKTLVAAGRTPKEVKEVLKGITGVVELYRLNAFRRKGLGVSIGRVMTQLAQPRNAAVHAGGTLNADIARSAVQTARELLVVSPLPGPRSLRTSS